MTVLVPDVSRESGNCQCEFVFLGAGTSHIVWVCWSLHCPLWQRHVLLDRNEIPTHHKPWAMGYMSPAVRRRCPRAACLFQFTARTDIWVQTWRFISELFNGEDFSLSVEMPLIHTPQGFTASTKFPLTLSVLFPEARSIINIAQLLLVMCVCVYVFAILIEKFNWKIKDEVDHRLAVKTQHKHVLWHKPIAKVFIKV